MTSHRVAIAASSGIAAAAGARVAEQGGNAVDAAIAAALVALATEPGVVSLGGGAFFTVCPPGRAPLTIDGNVEMPGRGLPPERLGGGAHEVHMGYGGGVGTLVGHGTVATPGALAACGAAWRSFGAAPWKTLVEPACEHAREGFPLTQASSDYLVHAHEVVFGWHPDSFRALHDDAGRLLAPGSIVRIAHLAESLQRIADYGAGEFYRGELAAMIARDSEANDGVLTAADLAAYEPVVREPLRSRLGRWELSTNPPPAVGGITLSAMLRLMAAEALAGWSAADVARLARVQHAVLARRRDALDLSDDLERDAAALLAAASAGDLRGLESPSTIHVSAVDEGGLACSATMSAGYGSGVMPPGTGIWMNNCLGELELNRRGLVAGPPGTRLASNMAPTVGRRDDGSLLAIGSPGADRITSALLVTLLSFIAQERPIGDAVEQPRLHVELTPAGPRAAVEPGLDTSAVTLPLRPFERRSMFFGGVGVALWDAEAGFGVAADSRRAGGTALSG